MINEFPNELAIREQPLRERLLERRNRLQTQLEQVNEALTLMDQNPELSKMLELLQRVLRF